MKKLFLFAAAICAALTVNAQDYRNIQSESDYTITGATKSASSEDDKIIYDVAANDLLVMSYGNTEAQYKNTSGKDGALTVKLGEYIEFGGKNGVLYIYNVTEGAKVIVHCAAKGSQGLLTVSEGATGDDVVLPAKSKGAEGADEDGYVWVDATFTATATEVTLKEINNGFRIESISVDNGETGISNTTIAPKAQKVMENGQLVIIRDGVKYNALGTVME